MEILPDSPTHRRWDAHEVVEASQAFVHGGLDEVRVDLDLWERRIKGLVSRSSFGEDAEEPDEDQEDLFSPPE